MIWLGFKVLCRIKQPSPFIITLYFIIKWQRNCERFVFTLDNKFENITLNKYKIKFKIKLFYIKILILFKILWLEIIKCLYWTKM